MKVETSTRVVFVLGRRTDLDARAIEAAAAGASRLIVLSLGYPVSRAQQRAVDAALGLAGRLGVTVDAQLVTDRHDLAALAGQADRVHVTGSRGERRRAQRRLSRT